MLTLRFLSGVSFGSSKSICHFATQMLQRVPFTCSLQSPQHQRPLGHNPLAKTVSKICSSAGILATCKTNHSLRAMSTSGLYHSGVDEQLIMERTGHKSTDDVRSYKRTTENQGEALSDILNGKTPRVDKPSALSLPSSTPIPTQNFIQSSSHNHIQGFNLSLTIFSNCTVHFNIGTSPHKNKVRIRTIRGFSCAKLGSWLRAISTDSAVEP